jgi:hypothetical protein
MRWSWKTATLVSIAALLLSSGPAAWAQKPSAPPKASMPMPMPMSPAQPSSAATQPSAQQRVVVVEPIRVFDPFFEYHYPYAYAPDYMQSNFGFVKLKTDAKDDSVYVDGGFADKISKAKKFALRPGNHVIEVRDSEGVTRFKQRIAVLVGKTTELKVG